MGIISSKYCAIGSYTAEPECLASSMFIGQYLVGTYSQNINSGAMLCVQEILKVGLYLLDDGVTLFTVSVSDLCSLS